MRKGFGLIQVIFFMVILSGLLTVTMKYATLSTKQTSDLYQREAAELFMQSALELALLGASQNDKNSGCLHQIKIISKDQRFIVDINLTNYFLYENDTSLCDRKTSIKTEDSNGMVLLEMTLESNNSHPKNQNPLRLIRKTLQRL